MRPILLFAWLMLPIGFGAYHYGPGQDRLILDDAATELAAGEEDLAAQQPAAAVKQFDAALALIPEERTAETRRVRLERAKARMQAQQLPAAYDELTILVDEMTADSDSNPELLADARQSLASAQYFLTWLMRLEGASRDLWEPEIEAARQNYRLLAEQADASDDEQAAEGHRKDLEAAIRLARMDLSDLQALAIPSQCKGCCSGQCQCKGKGKKKSKKDGDKKARGAGSGPPPDGRGS